ncbi:hypothetical protein [Sulfurimonas sp.]|jgi:hypothetical protein|nr:hypothetical protein [Sulfurimonas sp.]
MREGTLEDAFDRAALQTALINNLFAEKPERLEKFDPLRNKH